MLCLQVCVRSVHAVCASVCEECACIVWKCVRGVCMLCASVYEECACCVCKCV